MLSKVKESRIAKDVVIGANIEIRNAVIIEEGTEICSGAVLNGPVYIGPNTYIGNNTLIRDHCSIGKGAIIGFSSEIKNSVLFDGVKTFGLCYVGDSVIGKDTQLSSGVITVNTDTPKQEITMNINGKTHNTGFMKLGAIIGDNCDIGVNSLICPGKRIASNSVVMPGSKITEDMLEDTS
ncbi:MAG: hypothetical protein ACTSQF_12280 [Candidatus Heimdallarchaeaceae archaeon]